VTEQAKTLRTSEIGDPYLSCDHLDEDASIRNHESERAALQVTDGFMAAFNARRHWDTTVPFAHLAPSVAHASY